MLDDDFFDIDEDLLNATEFGRNIVDEENGTLSGSSTRLFNTMSITIFVMSLLLRSERSNDFGFCIYVFLGAAPGDIDNISVVLRELNCTGEDQLTNQSFHDKSFIMNNELKLIENRTRKFHNQKLFGMDVAPEVVADIDMLNMLINKARYAIDSNEETNNLSNVNNLSTCFC